MSKWKLQDESSKGRLQIMQRANVHSPMGVMLVHDRIPDARIQTCGFVADIMISKNEKGQIYHYVIQRLGSAEIEHWGQELSFKRALECIDDFLAPFRNSLRYA